MPNGRCPVPLRVIFSKVQKHKGVTCKGEALDHARAKPLILCFAQAWSPFGGQSCALRMHACCCFYVYKTTTSTRKKQHHKGDQKRAFFFKGLACMRKAYDCPPKGDHARAFFFALDLVLCTIMGQHNDVLLNLLKIFLFF